jgi:guanine deaminase
MVMENDKLFLLRAIELASDSISEGGGPFGAVIVKDNKIISEASNRVVMNNDATAHAEILAIRQASSFLMSHELHDCTLYSSCEPCPMCLGAIYWSGIKKVIYSCDRTDAEEAGFSDKLIYNEIMLDPAKRKISFIRLNGTDGKEVFRKWDELENKTTY